jgi:hypothetical protein
MVRGRREGAASRNQILSVLGAQMAGKLILVGADKLSLGNVMGIDSRLLISVGGGLLLVLAAGMGWLRGGWQMFALIVGTFLLTELVDVIMGYAGLRGRARTRVPSRPVNVAPAVAPGVSPSEVAIY